MKLIKLHTDVSQPSEKDANFGEILCVHSPFQILSSTPARMEQPADRLLTNGVSLGLGGGGAALSTIRTMVTE